MNELADFPLCLANPGQQHDLSQQAEIMLASHSALQDCLITFTHLLQNQWPHLHITGKLANWHHLTPETFHQELKKQKINLQVPWQTEWISRFTQHKNHVLTIADTLAQTDQKINGMVYNLYGLTDPEIAVIEGQ